MDVQYYLFCRNYRISESARKRDVTLLRDQSFWPRLRISRTTRLVGDYLSMEWTAPWRAEVRFWECGRQNLDAAGDRVRASKLARGPKHAFIVRSSFPLPIWGL